MKNTIRIILLVILLIGGTSIFAFWALYNFNNVFSDFEKISIANTTNVIPRAILTEDTPTNNVTEPTLDDPSISEVAVPPEDKPIKENITQEIKKEDFEFTFPKSPMDVYKGCKYEISWKSSSDINSVDLSFTDAGTSKPLGPVTSGVPKNISDKKITGFNWKVGSNIWPGRYYVLVSNINGNDFSKKSASLNVKEIPDEIDTKDIEKFCNQ